MSVRINITIPDDLHNDLQVVKGNLNISKICQQALARAVDTEKRINETISDIDKLVKRLRKERMTFAGDFYDLGNKDGIRDAYQMSFEDFHHISLYMDAWSPGKLFDWGASSISKKRVADKDFPGGQIQDFEVDDFMDVYFEGWLGGVLEIWSRIKDNLSMGSGYDDSI